LSQITVAVPTRGRPAYLEVALSSIAPQAVDLGARLIVVLDGPDPPSAEVAARHGAEIIALPAPRGLNVARNAVIDRVTGLTDPSSASPEEPTADGLIVFCDDDVEAPPGWLAALTAGAAAHPHHDAFGGPIRAWLEGGGPPCCGREPAPITTLDLGGEDRDAEHVWGANLALRPRAVRRVGRFDERLAGRGDEEEWLDRLRSDGGRVRYLAAAGLMHRRTGADARLAHLARAGYHLGRSSRANDLRKAVPPPLAAELRGLAGAVWHTLARRCGYGVVFAAHAAGRIQEALDPAPAPVQPGDFVSGYSGYVAGRRAVTSARVADAVADARSELTRRRLARDSARWAPVRHVHVLALERTDAPNILDGALSELRRSRHRVTVARGPAGDRGRFENLNRLADGDRELSAADWLIVIDDDVALPPGFLDSFLYLAERHDLSLAQPAHRRLSHAAWPVTRRRSGSVLRETAFVEIGPLVAFRRDAMARLLPFPGLRVGWGVDAHWGALAAEHGWRVGVIDATAISHALRPVAASYDQSAAMAESRAFLAVHPHITAAQAARTLQTHRSW
jgi:glycosyltransferase involved in cell wall biosynthesis